MSIDKEVKATGMPWEAAYGYAQAVKVGDTIYISGQLGNDAEGNVAGSMEVQMRQTYENTRKLLEHFGATLDNVVEEVVYVTDMDAAFAAAGPVRKAAYTSDMPEVASTILVTPRLALPTQLVEIKLIART